jgi:hypothetical protein
VRACTLRWNSASMAVSDLGISVDNLSRKIDAALCGEVIL